ncbi:hypothetical protein BKA56DRAFT_207109 [Ilyonectria sp. MPI-CAGE-AT-0026]|nr:hypothetical protein BKA56DRAFT_207109 [Ilyonectria sp. MPI-CAGE-AT-0026]
MPTPRSPPPKRRWPGESSEGFPRPRCPLSRRSPRFFPLSFTVSSLVEPVFSRLSPTPRLAAASQLPLPLPTVAVFCTFLAACASHARSSHCRQSYPAEPILGISRQALTVSHPHDTHDPHNWSTGRLLKPRLVVAHARALTRSTRQRPDALPHPHPPPLRPAPHTRSRRKETRSGLRRKRQLQPPFALSIHPPSVPTHRLGNAPHCCIDKPTNR